MPAGTFEKLWLDPQLSLFLSFSSLTVPSCCFFTKFCPRTGFLSMWITSHILTLNIICHCLPNIERSGNNFDNGSWAPIYWNQGPIWCLGRQSLTTAGKVWTPVMPRSSGAWRHSVSIISFTSMHWRRIFNDRSQHHQHDEIPADLHSDDRAKTYTWHTLHELSYQ